MLPLAIMAVPLVWGQVGNEPISSNAMQALYPVEWPAGPSRDLAPAWAQPGQINFARWDGGPIETAKAFLSGWPGFNPPDPDTVYAMTNWYDPRTISLLRAAGVNGIWVTLSNGFSIPTEKRQRDQLKVYIDRCHSLGIHVIAYESIANLFWEDMYEKVPESRNWISIGKDGKPVPYGAAAYTKVGRITRYMANLSHPGWRDYLLKRIDLVIDAGADGVIYDNNFSNALFDTYKVVFQYASSRKRDFLLMGNFHANTYVFNRLLNSITTEDGLEPGVYANSNVKALPKETQEGLLPVAGGALVNNIGLLRIHQTLSEGWKPFMIEDGHREVGERLSNPMSAARHQLALAEDKMFGASMELFVEGAFARGLWNHEPETMEIWQAIGRYNRFFIDNKALYTGYRSCASVAIILDDDGAGLWLLNGLAARNVIYDVLYEHDLTPERLTPYSAVAVLTAETVRERAVTALERYISDGGKLFLAGDAATRDEKGRLRTRRPFFGGKFAKGECVYYEKLPPLDSLASALLSSERTPAVRITAPPGVLYNVVEQPEVGRVLIHLLNYTLRPVFSLHVDADGAFVDAKLLSPDAVREPLRIRSSSRAGLQLEVPLMKIYSLIVLQKAGRTTTSGK